MTPVFGHGHLRLYLLSLLDESPKHGYELIQEAEQIETQVTVAKDGSHAFLPLRGATLAGVAAECSTVTLPLTVLTRNSRKDRSRFPNLPV